MSESLSLGQMAGIFALGLLASIALTATTLWAMRRSGVRQQIREDTPASHEQKQGTPSMGGIGMVVTLLLGAPLAVRLSDSYGWDLLPVWGVMTAFALIGLADDYLKLKRQTSVGLKARYRISIEFVVALLFVFTLPVVKRLPGPHPTDVLGFAGWPAIAYIILRTLVVVATANAVNFTDGLDGLAAGLVSICAASLGLACWMLGGAQLALFSALLAGVAAGFLWLNVHPAQIFMGDVGSLGLGALLGAIAVVADVELLFAVLAGAFVIETLSVIIQVVWFRRTGKRVFLMAPLHHSFELRGWSEPQIVSRLWLVGAVCGAVGLVIVAGVVQ